MQDTNKQDENMPEEKNENIETKPEDKQVKTDIKEEKKDIKESKKEKTNKEESIQKTEKTEGENETVKTQEKKEKTKKEKGQDPDFKYIVRISNTDIAGEKNIVYGLSSIKGVGIHMATLIASELKIDRKSKFGKLSDSQIQMIQEKIDNINEIAPRWMLNHRKDYETGKDIHLISSEIDMKLRDEINIMKKIRSYRGIRHERGLPVRGQRTRANNRRGLALGVSKKREPSSK